MDIPDILVATAAVVLVVGGVLVVVLQMWAER